MVKQQINIFFYNCTTVCFYLQSAMDILILQKQSYTDLLISYILIQVLDFTFLTNQKLSYSLQR